MTTRRLRKKAIHGRKPTSNAVYSGAVKCRLTQNRIESADWPTEEARMIRFLAIAVLAIFVLPSNVRAVDFQQGIDISHFQPSVNWTSMKNSGIKFAFAKATEGVDFVDVRFHTHMANAIAAGMPIGPYHFARLNSG